MFFSRKGWRRTDRRDRTAVDLSVTAADGAWLAYVRVSAGVMRSTAADPRVGTWAGRGLGSRTTTVIAGARGLVFSFRVCVVVVTLTLLLTLTVVLPTRVDRTALLFLLVASVRP